MNGTLKKYIKGQKAVWRNWGFAYLNIFSPKSSFKWLWWDIFPGAPVLKVCYEEQIICIIPQNWSGKY